MATATSASIARGTTPAATRMPSSNSSTDPGLGGRRQEKRRSSSHRRAPPLRRKSLGDRPKPPTAELASPLPQGDHTSIASISNASSAAESERAPRSVGRRSLGGSAPSRQVGRAGEPPSYTERRPHGSMNGEDRRSRSHTRTVAFPGATLPGGHEQIHARALSLSVSSPTVRQSFGQGSESSVDPRDGAESITSSIRQAPLRSHRHSGTAARRASTTSTPSVAGSETRSYVTSARRHSTRTLSPDPGRSNSPHGSPPRRSSSSGRRNNPHRVAKRKTGTASRSGGGRATDSLYLDLAGASPSPSPSRPGSPGQFLS